MVFDINLFFEKNHFQFFFQLIYINTISFLVVYFIFKFIYSLKTLIIFILHSCHFLFYFHHYHLLNSYMFLVVSIQQNLLWPFHVIDFSLIQSLFYFFLSVMGCLIYNLRYQILFQHFLQCLCKCRVFYVDCKAIYIYIV